MPCLRPALLVILLLLSGCTKSVYTAPDDSDCSYFNNCRCNDWYGTCSGHG